MEAKASRERDTTVRTIPRPLHTDPDLAAIGKKYAQHLADKRSSSLLELLTGTDHAEIELLGSEEHTRQIEDHLTRLTVDVAENFFKCAVAGAMELSSSLQLEWSRIQGEALDRCKNLNKDELFEEIQSWQTKTVEQRASIHWDVMNQKFAAFVTNMSEKLRMVDNHGNYQEFTRGVVRESFQLAFAIGDKETADRFENVIGNMRSNPSSTESAQRFINILCEDSEDAMSLLSMITGSGVIDNEKISQTSREALDSWMECLSAQKRAKLAGIRGVQSESEGGC